LVFVTKYRRKVFDGDALQRLQAIFEKVGRDFQAGAG
jgi:putative transposase